MLAGSCLMQLVPILVSFANQSSVVHIKSSGATDNISSMLLQFRTSQPNTQILKTMNGSRSFAVVIRNGSLRLEYNFSETSSGSIELGLVDTNKWVLFNITSKQNSTFIDMSENDNFIMTSCELKLPDRKSNTIPNTILGSEFSNLLRTTGLQISGSTSNRIMKHFDGCIGHFSLNGHVLDLFNTSKIDNSFERSITGASENCQACGKNVCVTGLYVWDRTKGHCDCRCSVGYEGMFCQNRTMTEVDDGDDVDSELIYIAVGITVGVLLLVAFTVCVVVYMKRNSSSVFGVYNPKRQEQMQGQQMNPAFTLPNPEKLI